ncbi:MAG TPA: hypothetical protein RMH99_06130 [Sandaracinaceae bacterium LLY-WYZ-13_1]|nr:hypothetical protein [Sandaracinaceae bacterium LLY-WYZ-13_1]
MNEVFYAVRHHPPSDELGLEPGREYVLPGLVLAWLAHRGLLSPGFEELVGEEVVAQVVRRELTGPQLLARVGGIVDATMVAERARAHLARYFELEEDEGLLGDFRATFGLAGGMPEDIYQVPDTWASYDRIEPFFERSLVEAVGAPLVGNLAVGDEPPRKLDPITAAEEEKLRKCFGIERAQPAVEPNVSLDRIRAIEKRVRKRLEADGTAIVPGNDDNH